jgi:hypothetical protein
MACIEYQSLHPLTLGKCVSCFNLRNMRFFNPETRLYTVYSIIVMLHCLFYNGVSAKNDTKMITGDFKSSLYYSTCFLL